MIKSFPLENLFPFTSWQKLKLVKRKSKLVSEGIQLRVNTIKSKYTYGKTLMERHLCGHTFPCCFIGPTLEYTR